MAILPQLKLFDWRDMQPLCDLERLRLVLEYMPDEELMGVLHRHRAGSQRLPGSRDVELRAGRHRIPT